MYIVIKLSWLQRFRSVLQRLYKVSNLRTAYLSNNFYILANYLLCWSYSLYTLSDEQIDFAHWNWYKWEVAIARYQTFYLDSNVTMHGNVEYNCGYCSVRLNNILLYFGNVLLSQLWSKLPKLHWILKRSPHPNIPLTEIIIKLQQ